MKVIVAGSRKFNNYRLLCKTLDNLLKNTPEVVIVSGMAQGADLLGKDYGKENGYVVVEFPAEWDNIDKPESEIGYRRGKPYWKLAGHARNEKMAQYADALVAFWDGKSRGTADMISRAKKHGLKIRIIQYVH